MQAGELPLYSMYATGTVNNNVFIKQCGTSDSILHALCTGCNAWISSCLLTLFGPAELAGSLQRKLGVFEASPACTIDYYEVLAVSAMV